MVTNGFQGDWCAWLDSQDVFFPTAEWPGTYRELFLKPAKNYAERFTFFIFLVGNGVDPSVSGKLTLITGERYDGEAKRHVNNLIKSASNADWMQKYNYPDGHNSLRRWQLTGTEQPPALEPAHETQPEPSAGEAEN